jgi:histidyl-tRNA synthetase
MAYANKLGVPFVVLLGEDELAQGVCAVKDMRTGQQVSVLTGDAAAHIKAGLAQGYQPIILEK